MEENFAVSLLRNASQLRDTERLTGRRCHFGALAAIRSNRWVEVERNKRFLKERVSTMNRRDFLGKSLICSLALDRAFLRAAKARAQSLNAPAGSLFTIEKLAENVFAAIAKPVTLLNCNAAIFVNFNDILVVDSHSKPSAAAALVAQVRREVSTKPVRYIVNTHFHWDHTQGMPYYRSIVPTADVIASGETRKSIESLAIDRLKASMEATQSKLDKLRQETPKNESERAYQQRAVADMTSYLREMRNYQPDLPNITFDDSLIIHDRNHEIHVLFRGRGHTSGDVVVFASRESNCHGRPASRFRTVA